MLDEINRAHQPITADLDCGEQIFISRMLRADRSEGFILVEYSTNKSANAALLALEAVAFNCYERSARIEFMACTPQETQYEGGPAIGLQFPRVYCRLTRPLLGLPRHAQTCRTPALLHA